MIAALRRLPAPLLVAQLGAIAVTFIRCVLLDQQALGAGAPKTLLAGSEFALPVLSIVGFAWLARRLAGTARLGVRIAFAATLLGVVCQVASLAFATYGVLSSNTSVRAIAVLTTVSRRSRCSSRSRSGSRPVVGTGARSPRSSHS